MRTTPGESGKVLFVDDDTMLTDLLSFALAREGFAVQVANRGAHALHLVRAEPPDVAVLDVNLPDTDGFTLCGQIRATVRIPIVLLTVRQSPDEMVEGFRRGADDYLAKPFDMRVLSYRLRALLRRCSAGALSLDTAVRTYPVADGSFDAEFNELRRGIVSAKLTGIEGKILRLLVTHEGQVLSIERILERVWGYDTESNVSVIKTHIRRLRLKIASVFGDEPLVHTIPGLGYTYRRPHPELGQHAWPS